MAVRQWPAEVLCGNCQGMIGNRRPASTSDKGTLQVLVNSLRRLRDNVRLRFGDPGNTHDQDGAQGHELAQADTWSHCQSPRCDGLPSTRTAVVILIATDQNAEHCNGCARWIDAFLTP